MLGVYSRISRLKENGKDRSIHDQKQLGEEKAANLNLKFRHYVDKGISGAGEFIDDRPALSQLLEDIIEGTITTVFIIDESRLSRNPRTKYLITDIFKDYNVITHSHIDGVLDYSNPDTEFISEIKGIIHKRQVTETKIKIKSALKRNAKEGKANNPNLPYGHRKDKNGYQVIDEEEAKVVKRIYEMSLDGFGTSTIANALNKEGIPTRYAMKKGEYKPINPLTKKVTVKEKKNVVWSQNTILQMIKNTIYKGDRNYMGEVYSVPAIVTPDYWHKVNDNLQNNKYKTGKRVTHRYLLKNILRCGNCGKNYYGKKTKDGKNNYYHCASARNRGGACGNRGINIDVADRLAWEILFENKLLIKLVKQHFQTIDKASEIKRLEQGLKIMSVQLKENEKELNNTIRLTLKETITELEGEKELKRIRQEKNELDILVNNTQRQLESYQNVKQSASDITTELNQIKNKTSFNDKKAILLSYVSDIITSFSDARYTVTFKFNINIPDEVFRLDRKYKNLHLYMMGMKEYVFQNNFISLSEFDEFVDGDVEYNEFIKSKGRKPRKGGMTNFVEELNLKW